MAAPRNSAKDDFDAPALARQVDDHAKDMASIGKRIDDLENKFGTHEKIANTLCETSATAIKMEEMLEKSFLKLLTRNDHIREEIRALIKITDRDTFQTNIKKWGTWVGAAFLFLVAQVSIELIKWLVSFLHSTIIH